MKFKNKIQMFEDFASSADASNSTTPSSATTKTTVAVDKTNTKSGEAIRQEVIKDVDTILTNLAELSNQITESVEMINEAGIEDIIKSIKAKVAYAKGEGMLKGYGKVLTAANPNQLEKQKVDAISSLQAALEKIAAAKENAKGDAKKPLIAKEEAAKAKIQKIESRVEAVKAKADNKLAEFKEKLGKVEGEMAEPLKGLFTARKLRLERTVQEDGLELKAKMAQEAGKKEAAEKAKAELEEIAAKQKELEDKIKNGELEANDDIEELSGIQPFLPEVGALTAATDKVKAVKDKISNAGAAYEGVSFEDNFELAYELTYDLNEDIATFFSGAKGEDDVDTAVKQLDAVKKLAAELKAAAAEEYKAKKALYDKVKGQETNKSIIVLAGGEGDKAEETESGKFKMGALIPKWGGDAGFIAPEEYADIKKSDEVLNNVDQAITDVQTKGGSGGEDDLSKSAEDVAKEALGDQFDAHQKISDPEEMTPEQTDEDGNVIAPAKKKWKDVKSYKGKDAEGNDTAEEVMYALPNDTETESVNVPAGEPLTESFAFKSSSVADRFRSLM